ncbi:Hypp2218 [Branchiostoma lanceolatum]|uniref:Hypp2218 protein n=1 Tax=Branchiostoma lanceolatum TaxID=7740 RepID=A0A8J9ZPG1_BRALA|nr:Hypp2218 [Branchiostoma lanceolatum]
MANLVGSAVVLLSVCILHVTTNLIRLEVGQQYQYRYEATTEVRNVGVFLTRAKVTVVPLKHLAEGQLCQMDLTHVAMNFVANQQYGSPTYEGTWDFSKWLSFVMTSHGEVISIFYPPGEDKEVLAMKKGILGTLSARLHDGSESSTRKKWRYEVDENGHEGQHRAGYSAEQRGDHTLFKKEKHGDVGQNVKASHKKLPGPRMAYDDMKDWIAGNLTCTRTIRPKSSSKRTECFRHIVDLLARLTRKDLNKVSSIYLRRKMNETTDIENRDTIVAGFGALASNDSLEILMEAVLLSPEPVFELVEKFLLHVSVLDHPPPEAITKLLEKRCFGGEQFSTDPKEDHKLRSQGFLVLGVIAKLLKGKDDRRSEGIVRKLSEHLEVFDPSTHRKRRATMSPEETKVHDRYKANLLGALGNAGCEKSYHHVLSYLNTTDSPHILRRHASAALGGFHNIHAAHTLVSLVKDEDEEIRRAAKLEFQTHPKATELADVYLKRIRRKRGLQEYPALVDLDIDGRRSVIQDAEISLDMPQPEYTNVKPYGSRNIGSSVGTTSDNGASLRAAVGKVVESLKNARTARTDALKVLGNVDDAQLANDPIVAAATTSVRLSVDLVSEAIRELSAFCKVATDVGGVTLPIAVRRIHEGLWLISQTMDNVFQSPKTAMKDVEKAFYKIQHAVEVVVEARKILKNAATRNGGSPFWYSIMENAESITGELTDSTSILGHGSANLNVALHDVAMQMKGIIVNLSKLFGALGTTFESLDNKALKLKEGYAELRNGYRSAKFMMDGVFGPKMDIEFPRQQLRPGHSRQSQRSCPSTMGYFPSNGNGRYSFDGVDLEVEAGSYLVVPFSGRAVKSSNISGQVTIIADELGGIHVVIDNIDMLEDLQNKTVYKGERLGLVRSSHCRPNSIHVAMVNISEEAIFAIDPTPYLEQKEMPAPQINQQCSDIMLRIKVQ